MAKTTNNPDLVWSDPEYQYYNTSGLQSTKQALPAAKEQADRVVHPSHYTEGRRYETLDKIDDFLSNKDLKPSVAYSIGTALKYLDRMGLKAPDQEIEQTLDEKMAEDLDKSIFYLTLAKYLLQGKDMPAALKEIHK